MRGNGRFPTGALPAGLILILAALAIALYLPLLPRTSILDDDDVAVRNPAVITGAGILRTPFASLFYRPVWRPLTTVSYRIDRPRDTQTRAAGGAGNPAAGETGARAPMGRANLMLFVIAVLLAMQFMRRVGHGLWVSALMGAALLLHPGQMESVLTLAGRSELLAICIMLGALWLYASRLRQPARLPGEQAVRHAPPTPFVWAAWGMLAFLALLAHEIAVILPLLVIGYELTLGPATTGSRAGGRGRYRDALIALGLACMGVLLWLALRAAVLDSLPGSFKRDVAWDYVLGLDSEERLRLALYLPVLYTGMLGLVVPIVPGYAYLLARPPEAPPVTLGDPSTFGVHVPAAPQAVLGSLVLLVALGVFLMLRRRAPRGAFGLWMFLTSIVAVLPLLRANGSVASTTRLFFPLLGLLMTLGALGELLSTRWRAGRAERRPGLEIGLVALLALGALGLGVCTRNAGTHWRSQETLLSYFAATRPLAPEVPLWRSNAAIQRRDLAGAAALLEESIGLFPRAPRALLTLGLIRAQQGNQSMAGRLLSDAAVVAQRVMPGSSVEVKAHLSVGTMLARQKLEAPALVAFRKALQADSTNIEALSRAGLLEALSFNTARDGVRHLTRALELDRQQRILGRATERLQAARARAIEQLELEGNSSEGYDAAMGATDSVLTAPADAGATE